jgi:hypothetical protein
VTTEPELPREDGAAMVLAGPAVTEDRLGPVDLVLLSSALPAAPGERR